MATTTSHRRHHKVRRAVALLVNAPREHRIGSEIAAEFDSADRVDLLCSFVKWSGYIRIRDALVAHLRLRDRPLRIITTAYMGATERRALDELSRMGAEIRVSYNTKTTRLHAKAWMFHRETGFSTAYIGSSNLSAPALTDGLEWNVRASAVDARAVLEKFSATFDGYWKDPEFEPYDPERDAAKLDLALSAEGRPDDAPSLLFDVRPYPFQQEILDRLEAVRVTLGRRRNLIVAATGTGKTLIAAFDYARLAVAGRLPSLLFVAHRDRILEQAIAVFRMVLGAGYRSFGELLVGGKRPEQGDHVFASVLDLFNEGVDIPAVRLLDPP